jgi:putative ABC transport system ATP-binding protein
MTGDPQITPSYELEDASRSYGRDSTLVRALDALDLTIKRGEFVAVFGPSGSGKTTLLQLLGALDRPSGGSIQFEGQPLELLGDSALSELRLRAMGFIFQQFNLIPTLDAAANVEAALAPLAMSAVEVRETAEKQLQAVGLRPRAHHLPTQLSGGEQQRVALARAFVHSPRILFADEPTGNLDAGTGQGIIQLMEELNQETRTTLILVTHDLDLAAHAHRTIRLADGEIVSDVVRAA